MLFNSLPFAIFLPVVFALYWALGGLHRRYQNALLIVASYVFYGWWDWRFLGLIILSSAINYAAGLALGNTGNERQRKHIVGWAVAVNLIILGFFKYYGFFMEQFAGLLAGLGWERDLYIMQVVLPIGISFFTFQLFTIIF